jgi:hypothetical protein
MSSRNSSPTGQDQRVGAYQGLGDPLSQPATLNEAVQWMLPHEERKMVVSVVEEKPNELFMVVNRSICRASLNP